MALIITHQFVSSKPDGNDSTLIRPSNWNANHIITGTVDETMLSLSDITTANVSTSMHGFVPKLPNDSTKFLNGVGMYSTPAGGGDVTQAGNNDFIGVNNFASRTQLGSIPLCDNALLTIYQTMDGSMNTSMVDSIATASGTVDYITNLNVITHGQGTIGNILTGIYVRNDIDTGTTASSYGIWIDSPQVGASVASTVGLLISAQDGGIATNLFSMGRGSQNFFEGIFTQSPYNQQKTGTISDGGTNQYNGQIITGSGTFFTNQVCVCDIITNGSGDVGQVWDINSDTQLYVWPPNSFNGDSGSPINVYPATVRMVDQLTSQGLAFAFNQSAWVISAYSGLGSGANNFVIGKQNNMVDGETEAAIVLGGQYNHVSGNESAIIGGYGNTVSGQESVTIGGYGLTVTGSQIIGFGLGGNTYTLSQSHSFIVMDGNVGLGEISPQAPLHITHSTGSSTLGTAIRINSVNGGAGCGGQILWTDNADILQMAAISGVDDDNWGGRMVFFTSPQTDSSPGGTPIERMRISSSGYVGINTQNPDGILHVNASTHGTGIPTFLITQSQYEDTIFSIQSKGRAILNAYDDYNGAGPALTITQYGSDAGASLVVNQNGTGSGAGPALIVTQSASKPSAIFMGGDVGIGTTAPAGLFDVNGYLTVLSSGNTQVSGSFSATTIAGGYQNWSSGNSTLNFDLSKGNVQTLTLTLNTSPTFTNVVGGQSLTLVLTQDGTGGHTVTWPGTVNDSGNLEVNLAPDAVTTLNFVSTDGSTLTPVTQFGAEALPGYPKRTQATGIYAAGGQNITIVSVAYGADQNGIQILFDTNIQYVVTEVYQVVESTPPVISIGLANTGSGSTATGNDIVTAINTGIANGIITASIPSPGTGFVGTGSVTLGGAQDQFFTPIGGELWFDTNALYVGQADGSFKTIAYTS